MDKIFALPKKIGYQKQSGKKTMGCDIIFPGQLSMDKNKTPFQKVGSWNGV